MYIPEIPHIAKIDMNEIGNSVQRIAEGISENFGLKKLNLG